MVSGLGFAGVAEAPDAAAAAGGFGVEVGTGFWTGLAGERTGAAGDGATGEEADGTSFSV